MKVLGILFIAILITACAKQTQDAAMPVRPAVPQDTAPAENAAGTVDSGTDKAFGAVNTTDALNIDDVRCDASARSITFRFKNNDVNDWQMNQKVPFPAPKGLAPVRVFVNSYEVNSGTPYIVNGERMFGPKTLFSDNCGGVELLKPGADVTCTLTPVPLKAATALAAGKNEIFVNSPTSRHIIQFTCT